MNQIFPVLLVIVLSYKFTHAGFLGSQLSYSAIPFAANNFGATYGANPFAAPLPVTPFSATHSYPVGYSTPPVLKFRSFGPFTTYASVRSHHKYPAYPAPVPSFYNAPPGLTYDAPPLVYNDYPVPNTVVKFGPPITTTTTTYSTTAAAAAPVAVANSFNGVTGW